MRSGRVVSLEGLRAIAEAQGWKVKLTGNSHWCFVPPDRTKRRVYTSSTPSDHRSILNFRRDLIHSGLRL